MLPPVLWSRIDLLRFRFQLWKSFGSGSGYGGSRQYSAVFKQQNFFSKILPFQCHKQHCFQTGSTLQELPEEESHNIGRKRLKKASLTKMLCLRICLFKVKIKLNAAYSNGTHTYRWILRKLRHKTVRITSY
jgi:hypothetical protein